MSPERARRDMVERYAQAARESLTSADSEAAADAFASNPYNPSPWR